MVKFIKKLAGFDGKKHTQIDDEYDEKEDLREDLTEEAEEAEEAEETDWIDEDYEEGQLSIDVYQTPKTIVVKSTIAGVKPEDIDISINNDMLTIRGKREEQEQIDDEDFLYKECYWGSFSL
jgi:HSP20 family protein